MRIRIKGRRSPFAFLFASPRREQYLAHYVLREYGRGRQLRDIFEDPYVQNRSTPEQRARLLERPEIVAAIGKQTVADVRVARAAASAAVQR
jgi:hypothetical protein